jgi:hypothetical protein
MFIARAGEDAVETVALAEFTAECIVSATLGLLA